MAVHRPPPSSVRPSPACRPIPPGVMSSTRCPVSPGVYGSPGAVACRLDPAGSVPACFYPPGLPVRRPGALGLPLVAACKVLRPGLDHGASAGFPGAFRRCRVGPGDQSGSLTAGTGHAPVSGRSVYGGPLGVPCGIVTRAAGGSPVWRSLARCPVCSSAGVVLGQLGAVVRQVFTLPPYRAAAGR